MGPEIKANMGKKNAKTGAPEKPERLLAEQRALQ